MRILWRPLALALPLVLIWSTVVAAPAASIPQSQVDAACADSKDALQRLREARQVRDDAQARYAEIIGEREETAYLELRLRDQISDREATTNDIRDRVIDRAIEVYMSGGTQITDLVFGVQSVDEIMAGQQLLEAVTAGDLASADTLAALREDMEAMRAELELKEQQLLDLEIEAADVAARLEEAAAVASSTYQELEGECQRLYNLRQAELARQRALQEARRRGAAGGISSDVTPGFICPMANHAVSFINDWGFPRSGGRTHKGTDVFASYGQKVFAVADGVVSLRSGGLGGTILWLTADYGVAFYYAHLSGYAPGLGSGQRVVRGQEIAYNGDSGNARGGAPHLHFQIHPGGRSSSPVNPYPTLSRACG